MSFDFFSKAAILFFMKARFLIVVSLMVVGWFIAVGEAVQARSFKNSQGVTIEAELKAVQGDQVTIVRSSDKREFTIPIGTLSQADQDYIEEWMEAKTPKPHESVKAGAKFSIDFPDLREDRKGNPAKVGVAVPASYDPAKPIPLFVWMSGGSGGSNATTAGVVDGSRFITAGLPFPKGANNPNQSNMVGDYDTIWEDYHQPMLKELFRRIPNIDKRLCILAGFSNGAHCIAGVLGEASGGGYPEFFNCYILVDGGNGDKRLKGGKGNFLFATWGEKSLNADNCEQAAKKASGMEVGTFEMKGIGHKFADVGKKEVKKWLSEIVFPATID